MTAPSRIQLSRRKSWKKPDNTIVVARPTIWGNPFPIARLGRAEAVRRFGEMLENPAETTAWLYPSIHEIKTKLRGKNLACWCPPPDAGEPDICHAAILLRIANAPETS